MITYPKRTILAAILSIPIAVTAHAAPSDTDPAFAIVDNLAASMDINSNGVVTAQEHAAFTDLAWSSMDANSNGFIESSEFLGWDVGLQSVADDRGSGGTYREVKLQLFGQWDQNSDGRVSQSEMREQARNEFAVSDTDGDHTVKTRELSSGSLTMMSLLSAVAATE